MTGLKMLSLFNNQLTSLPEEIVALTGLTFLNLRNNPLVKPQSPAIEAWIAGLPPPLTPHVKESEGVLRGGVGLTMVL